MTQPNKDNQKMSATGKRQLVFTLVLAIAFVGSYVTFAQYKPKVIKQIQDVKGLQSDDSRDIPLPEDAEKTSINKSQNSTQTTFYSNKTKDEIQEFYKNILLSGKWTVESQGSYQDFVVTKYKKDDHQISIITYDMIGDYKTLVSLEELNLSK